MRRAGILDFGDFPTNVMLPRSTRFRLRNGAVLCMLLDLSLPSKCIEFDQDRGGNFRGRLVSPRLQESLQFCLETVQ